MESKVQPTTPEGSQVVGAQDIVWSLEQMNAQASRVLAGDSVSTKVAKAFAKFVVDECQSALVSLREETKGDRTNARG